MGAAVVSIASASIPNDLRELAASIESKPVRRALLITDDGDGITVATVGREMDGVEVAGLLAFAMQATTGED